MNPLPEKITKRDGTHAAFSPKKIERAVFLAARSTSGDEKKARDIAEQVTGRVLQQTAEQFSGSIPTIEHIQDIVETSLIDLGYSSVAKSYIIYRKSHQDIRYTKYTYGVDDDLKLPLNALLVLQKRYLLRDDRGLVTETPGELFRRVARAVSRAELGYGSESERREMEELFFRKMTGGDFLPNSPTLMNAGTSIGQLAACFVLPIKDSLEDIFETVKNMALIHRTGGGTGFDFSPVRGRGELVSTTKGRASGPISFMSIFNQTTDVIIQGGKRRGANMGILRCDHPDIFEFVEAKLQHGEFANFNLSVGVTDRFIRAVKNNGSFDLVSPVTGKAVRTIRARALFDMIAFAAWRTGDPGLIFLDEINRRNPTPGLGSIRATNPCSEVLLLPYESCNLASINLSLMVRGKSVDWKRLREAVWCGIRFLDNVIDVTKYPLPEIQDITARNRKVGLGVMGFADMLIRMGISYTDKKAETMARKIMKFIRQHSLEASRKLAARRGAFPNLRASAYARHDDQLRNATVNAIAPTGTISIIAGCSSGIEPLFSLSFTRNVLGGTKLFEMHPLFEQELKSRGLYSREIISAVRKQGSISRVGAVPEELRRVFVTTFDVKPHQHLRIQAAFQKYTDNSVSKTVNLPHMSAIDDVKDIYLEAHRLRCKGITIYRYGSRRQQALSFGDGQEESDEEHMNDRLRQQGCFSGTCDI